jgi:hypothetical protein
MLCIIDCFVVDAAVCCAMLCCIASVAVDAMDRGECGNDRPEFGVHSVTQKLSAYNVIRVLNIIKL